MVNSIKSPPPCSISLIAWGMILLGCTNLWRTIGLARQSHMLAELGASLSPVARLLMALCWAIVFAVLSSLLWRQQPMARWAIPLAVLFYGAYQLGLIAFFFVSPAARTGWQALLVFYLSLSLLSYWVLNRRAAAHFWHTTGKTDSEAITSRQDTSL